MSDPTVIFCCPSAILTTAATYRSPKECELWCFSRSLSDLISSTPVTPETSPIPANFLAAILNESPFVIQFEKWVGGEKEETRCYIPHPGRDYGYLELEREVVKKGGWEWDWSYIKLRCEHEHTMFVVKYLKRVDRAMEERLRYLGKKGRVARIGENEGESWNEKWDLREESSFHKIATDEEIFQLDGEDKGCWTNEAVASEDLFGNPW